MHGDEHAILAAIRANPADDVVRLAYADWLDEHDRPERAELIRVQVELAGLPDEDIHPPTHIPGTNGCGVCRQYDALRERERELLEQFAADDLSIEFELPPHETLHATGSGFICPRLGLDLKLRRGFVDSVGCSASAWLNFGDDILARHPVEVVWLTDWPDVDLACAAALSPRWPGVRFKMPAIAVVRHDHYGPIILAPDQPALAGE